MSEEHDYDIRAEAEDQIAPKGRCYYCKNPLDGFGRDGLFIKESTKVGAKGICELCADEEESGFLVRP